MKFGNVKRPVAAMFIEFMPSFTYHKTHQPETEIKWLCLTPIKCAVLKIVVTKLIIIQNSNEGYGYNRNNPLTCWRRFVVEFVRNWWRTFITVTRYSERRSQRLDTYKGKVRISLFQKRTKQKTLDANESQRSKRIANIKLKDAEWQ